MNPLPVTTTITGPAVAVLALFVALYALLARERKTPYITNFIFPPSGYILFGVFLGLLAQALPPVAVSGPKGISGTAPSLVAVALSWVSLALLFIGMLHIVSNVWRLHNRQVNFRDDHLLRNLRLNRWRKARRRRLKPEPTYEHSPIELEPQQVIEALSKATFETAGLEGKVPLRTIAICNNRLNHSDPKISKLCSWFLSNGWHVQYTSCLRNPYEFVQILRVELGTNWTKFNGRLTVVDAYTPHFGFTDSIHDEKRNELARDGVGVILAHESYAGVHTATAKAFNRVGEATEKGTRRQPALLLYEGASALADLESIEQYRIFARHVLTSERMWGGMLTVFVEPCVAEPEQKLLATYADFLVT